ncbi:MAG: response regulator, partial [Actinomycetota bacterium]|nr:response regulator [Actinomycetota bacterium]
MSEERASVLVVDDDVVNRTLLAKNVEREGHRVTTAENGRQALEMLRADSFDVVLLDVVMPEMDGYAVLEEIQSDGSLRRLPVIMISALDEIESVVRCIELGAEDYLSKPFDPVLLRARINAGLTKKRLHELEEARVRDVFSRFVPEHVVGEVLRRTDDDLRLVGTELTGTVM